ncbi:condensation domain-containing protein, partial [Pseudomonas aeruginosa]
ELDLSGLADEELEAELKMLYAKEANTVIKIDVDIPIRAKIIRCSANKIILLMSIHHIASDGWSMRVLLQDLSEIYSD